MKVRKFRILRLRHHVSMVELGRACGVSAWRTIFAWILRVCCPICRKIC